MKNEWDTRNEIVLYILTLQRALKRKYIIFSCLFNWIVQKMVLLWKFLPCEKKRYWKNERKKNCAINESKCYWAWFQIVFWFKISVIYYRWYSNGTASRLCWFILSFNCFNIKLLNYCVIYYVCETNAKIIFQSTKYLLKINFFTVKPEYYIKSRKPMFVLFSKIQKRFLVKIFLTIILICNTIRIYLFFENY